MDLVTNASLLLLNSNIPSRLQLQFAPHATNLMEEAGVMLLQKWVDTMSIICPSDNQRHYNTCAVSRKKEVVLIVVVRYSPSLYQFNYLQQTRVCSIPETSSVDPLSVLSCL